MGLIGEIQLFHNLSGSFKDLVQLPAPYWVINGHCAVQLITLSLPLVIFFCSRPQVHSLATLVLPLDALVARGQRPSNFLTIGITGDPKEHKPNHFTLNNFTTLTILCWLLLAQNDRPLNDSTHPEYILRTHGGSIILNQLDELDQLYSVLGWGVS